MNGPRLGLCALALVFLTCASVSAMALDGTWRPPSAGTEFTFHISADGAAFRNFSREVVKVEGNYVYFRGYFSRAVSGGQWSSCRGILPTVSWEGAERRFDCDVIAGLFPLRVGNRVELYGRENGREFRLKYRVLAVKEIKTSIGIRSVFRIKYHVAPFDGRYVQRSTIYYDPELGIGHQGSHIIKAKGRGGSIIWDISDLKLPR